MTDSNAQKIARWAGGALVVVVALLYLFTLDNGLRPDELTGGDLITHQYAQVEARPGNAPGYPLYTMGGWVWFRVGKGLLGRSLNPIEVLSLYSVLWGLAAITILYLILLRVTNGRWPVALLLTFFYATTYFFWYYSVTTEQYTSAVLQTLLVVWLAFKWDDQPRDSLLLWLAFICGTMLANMVTTLFILPPLLWFICFRRNPDTRQFFVSTCLRRPKFVLAAMGLVLLPLVSYAYVFIRGAQHPQWRGEGRWTGAWDWFIQFLTIQQGRDELAPGLTTGNIFTGEFPWLMGHELTWLIFFGGLLGLAFLGRRRAMFLYSTLVIYFIFSWAYRFGNWFQVIIPAYPIFIIGVAAGVSKLVEAIGNRENWRLKSIVYLALIFVLAGLLVYRCTSNFARANQRNLIADTGLNPGWAILADNPALPAVVAGDFSERVALQYLHSVWGINGINPVESGAIGEVSGGGAGNIYISRQALAAVPHVSDRFYPQAAGEQLIALLAEPQTNLPAAATPINVDFGDQLTLVGWEIIQTIPLIQANWQVALYWQTPRALAENLTVSVRPLANGQLFVDNGEPVIQDHQPVWGYYPTDQWFPGEIVRDVYALELLAGIEPDAMQIVVYKTTVAGFENLGDTIVTFR
jgi:hypothetical protein